jgi:glutamate-1-semialdehyde 2,1-aminomutase
MDAIRVARGFTGREKIIKFEGGYHGHHDDVLMSIQPPRDMIGEVEAPNTVPTSAGIPRSRVAETVIAPFNQPEIVERILERHRGEIAAIIVEAVQFNIGVVPPEPGFLERLRELATEHGAVLIFDEVMTGFRVHSQGVQGLTGITPDLTTLGKVIGGGTIGAFGGRERSCASSRVAPGAADRIEPDRISSFEGTSGRPMGTMNGSPLVMAAALAVLTKVLTPIVYPRLQAMGTGRRQPGDRRRVRPAGICDQCRSQGDRDVRAAAGHRLPRLHRPRRRAVDIVVLVPGQSGDPHPAGPR